MELYLDSADFTEIETAFQLGFIQGLTTTPTFMHRQGITDVDGAILKLADMVPVLQVEALGEEAGEIYDEAHRLLALGLDKKKTVFKIPISMEGAKACKKLRDEDIMVNLHLVYTLQQAYIAMSAGANFVCPLVGRLQDQGHDALGLVEQCVNAVDHYGYNTKVMFSSVRHAEHVRNAFTLGVHVCTIPWKVMKQLTSNHFTDIGTQQFFEHTRLITMKVKDVIGAKNPIVKPQARIMDALVVMTQGKFGAVTICHDDNSIAGIFTDGDLRRLLEKEGEAALQKQVTDLSLNAPLTIHEDMPLYEASTLFKEKKVDTLIVVNNHNMPVGMLDIQDLVKLNG